MDTQNFIIDLLARGCSQEDAARLSQVSPGYVSQLLTAEDVKKKVEERRAVYKAEQDQRAQRVQQIHDDYLRVEKQTLASLERDMGMMRPGERVKLLSVLAAKKEPAPLLATGTESGAPRISVQVVLPAIVAQKFVMNERREIIGMDNGTTFAPMNSSRLVAEAREQAALEQRQEVVEQVKGAIKGSDFHIPQVTHTKDILSLFQQPMPEAMEVIQV